MNLSQLGPVVGPVLPQLLKGRTGRSRKGAAFVRGHATLAPVEDCLDVLFADRASEGNKPPGPFHGVIEGFGGKHSDDMVHAMWSSRQQGGRVKLVEVLHTPCMHEGWKRFQEELDSRNKGLQWLADEMKCSIQRVQNWVSRGVPKGAFPDVAKAFGESIDWAAGLAPPKRLQEAPAAPPLLDEDTRAFSEEYQRMDPHKRRALRQLAEVARLVEPPPEPSKKQPLGGMETNWGDLEETGE